MNGKTVTKLRKIYVRTAKEDITQMMWRLFKKEHSDRTHREKGSFLKNACLGV